MNFPYPQCEISTGWDHDGTCGSQDWLVAMLSGWWWHSRLAQITFERHLRTVCEWSYLPRLPAVLHSSVWSRMHIDSDWAGSKEEPNVAVVSVYLLNREENPIKQDWVAFFSYRLPWPTLVIHQFLFLSVIFNLFSKLLTVHLPSESFDESQLLFLIPIVNQFYLLHV